MTEYSLLLELMCITTVAFGIARSGTLKVWSAATSQLAIANRATNYSHMRLRHEARQCNCDRVLHLPRGGW